MKKSITIWRRSEKDCITTIEVIQWLPAVALVVMLLWYLATPNRLTAMSMATLLGIIVLAFVWARLQALHIRGSRKLHYSAFQVGDELEEELTLENRSAFPLLWAEFVDRSDIPGYTVASVRAADSRGSVTWHASAICSRRGVYTLGPWELLSGDPLGIFRVRKVYQQRKDILIYPPLAELPDLKLPYSGAQGDERPLHQPIRADTVNAFGARPYAPGDPLRHLHWRTTARKDDPFVKLFEPEAATSIWLVADCDRLAHRGQGDDSTFETMILVAATLASRLLRDQLAVGFFADAAERVVVLPQRGPQHQWDILKALAPLAPTDDRPLVGALQKMRHLANPRNMILVITPSLEMNWLPELRRLSGLRSTRHAQAVLLDPQSFGGGGSAERMLPVFARAGIQAQVIQRGQVRPISGAYGALRRWEFKSLATGRVVARQSPRAASAAETSEEPA